MKWTAEAEKAVKRVPFFARARVRRRVEAEASDAINEVRRGYRILLGGKLGRHPRLAVEAAGILTEAQVLAVVKGCIQRYKAAVSGGQRFADVLPPSEVDAFVRDIVGAVD